MSPRLDLESLSFAQPGPVTRLPVDPVLRLCWTPGRDRAGYCARCAAACCMSSGRALRGDAERRAQAEVQMRSAAEMLRHTYALHPPP